MKQFIIFFIKIYQELLSPRKGFCCAYRVVNGGKSCSEYGKYSIANFGVLQGSKLLFKRFRLCEKAYIVSQEEPKKDEKKPKDKQDDDALACFLLEGTGQAGCCMLGLLS